MADVRPLPLKVASALVLFSSLIYLAVVLGSEDQSGRPAAYFWFGVMVVAAGMAWFATDFGSRARAVAIGVSILFFALAVFSGGVFVWAFLIATALAAYSWWGADQEAT